MENRVQVFSCKEYFIMKDTIDNGLLAYENNGIFITSNIDNLSLEEFKSKVENILKNGY